MTMTSAKTLAVILYKKAPLERPILPILNHFYTSDRLETWHTYRDDDTF